MFDCSGDLFFKSHQNSSYLLNIEIDRNFSTLWTNLTYSYLIFWIEVELIVCFYPIVCEHKDFDERSWQQGRVITLL